jgi:hypothetical protein
VLAPPIARQRQFPHTRVGKESGLLQDFDQGSACWPAPQRRRGSPSTPRCRRPVESATPASEIIVSGLGPASRLPASGIFPESIMPPPPDVQPRLVWCSSLSTFKRAHNVPPAPIRNEATAMTLQERRLPERGRRGCGERKGVSEGGSGRGRTWRDGASRRAVAARPTAYPHHPRETCWADGVLANHRAGFLRHPAESQAPSGPHRVLPANPRRLPRCPEMTARWSSA